MKILAIDTATKVASVAVLEDKNVLAEKSILSNQNHSEVLLNLIQEVLVNANLTIKDIDEYAISNGPGSFTGLRVSAATTKAFAYKENANIYEVCTLDSLAYNALSEVSDINKAIIVPIIDARRKQVYYGIYELENNNLNLVSEYDCIDFVDVIKELSNFKNTDVYFVGDGVEIFKDEILQNGYKILSDENVNAKASSLKYGIKEENKRNFRNSKLFYFKQSQAERELEEKLKNDK